jgi:hypothetical protein
MNDNMNTPKRRMPLEHTAACRRQVQKFKQISCQSESELSEGSKQILRIYSSSLLSFFRCKLTHHQLLGKYSEYEIFSEAYHRATQAIRKDQVISNLYGWYKATGYNIIRECGRKEKKQRELKNKLKRETQTSVKKYGKITLRSDDEIPVLKILRTSLRNELDVKIIYLRIVDEPAWVDVCKVLIKEGDLKGELSKQCVERVRQRFRRALKKIPKIK